MKKVIRNGALFLTAFVVMLAFASCGCQGEQKPSTKDGGVIYCEAGELCIVTTASEVLTFNVENAEIDSAGAVEFGDLAEVEYTGEITDGDTSECTVSKVTVVPGDLLYDEADNASNNTKDSKKETKKEAKVTITAVSDVVYVTTSDVAVRASYDVKAKRVGTVNKGKKLTRTGKTSNGWSRVKYNGKDAYVINTYLTTKAPKKPDPKPSKSVVKMEGTIAEVTDDTVTIDTASGNDFEFSLKGATIESELEVGSKVIVKFKGSEDQPGKLISITDVQE